MTPEGDRPERLDLYLVRRGWAASRRAARELIALGLVRVNGRVTKKGAPISPRDTVEIEARPAEAALVPEAELPLEVLFEDAALIVVNKAAPMPCHPLRPGEHATVMNAVAARFPDAARAGEKPLEGGLIHRLDNGTSGALMIARTDAAFLALRTALRAGEIGRRYQALAAGEISSPLELTAPVGHRRKNPRKMAVKDVDGPLTRSIPRPAATLVRPLRRLGRFTLATVIPRTGLRHQIRVHLAHAGHPLAGDTLYGGPAMETLAEGRFWLHLRELWLISPISGAIHIEAPLPPDLKRTLQ